MTLAEFLNGRTEADTPLFVMYGDEDGNYHHGCNDEKYGVTTRDEFMERGYAEHQLTCRVKHVLTFEADGKKGYMIWIRIPEWDDALMEAHEDGWYGAVSYGESEARGRNDF